MTKLIDAAGTRCNLVARNASVGFDATSWLLVGSQTNRHSAGLGVEDMQEGPY